MLFYHFNLTLLVQFKIYLIMRLVFLGSSSFVTPILQDIKKSEGKSLLEVLLSRKAEIISINPSYLNLINTIEGLSKQSSEINEIENKLNSPIKLVGVVTQANTEHRGKIQKSATAIWAEENKEKLFQPEKINKQYDQWQSFVDSSFDVAVVASFGQIISQKILDTGLWVNWHPSKLPEYRGPCPMQQCLEDGKESTALSWIKMTKGMDAGEIYLQIPVQTNQMDFNLLAIKMSEIGKITWPIAVLSSIINNSSNDTQNIFPQNVNTSQTNTMFKSKDIFLDQLKLELQPKIQKEEEATFTKMLTKNSGLVNPNQQTAKQIYNHYLAYIQYPKTYFYSKYFQQIIRLDLVTGYLSKQNNANEYNLVLSSVRLNEELAENHFDTNNSQQEEIFRNKEFLKIDNKKEFLLLRCNNETYLKVESITLASGKKVNLKGFKI